MADLAGFSWRNPIHLLAFGLGAGRLPYAPGTAGTVVAVPLYLVLAGLPPWLYLVTLAGLFAIGVWLCDVTSRDLGVHDHSGIVWDEIVGYLVTMAVVPPGWFAMLAGFALFRLFDILKPPPIRQVDRQVAGGFGIMLDDLLAGAFAWICLQGLSRLVG